MKRHEFRYFIIIIIAVKLATTLLGDVDETILKLTLVAHLRYTIWFGVELGALLELQEKRSRINPTLAIPTAIVRIGFEP